MKELRKERRSFKESGMQKWTIRRKKDEWLKGEGKATIRVREYKGGLVMGMFSDAGIRVIRLIHEP